MADNKPNPAQIRGDIHKGLSADKRPGFDPAAAPLETDSEAGGEALSREQIVEARRTQRNQRDAPNTQSYGNAMRKPDEADSD